MLGSFVRYRHYVLISIFSFISGCMITTFFVKIDSNFPAEVIIKPDSRLSSRPMNVVGQTENSYLLIIVIVSSPNNINKRNTLRRTWLSFSNTNNDVLYYFVVGNKGLSDEQNVNLQAEFKENNDLLILTNITDNYRFLTNKVLETFSWIDQNINSYNYVLKCDDDSFVNVKDMVSILKTSFNNDEGTYLYWGFFSGKSHVFKLGKWQEPGWNLCDRYLPYALGGGYVLSQKLVHFISRNKQNLVLFKSEDVSVGTWLAPFHINRKHDCRFDTEYISRGCSNQYIVTHKRTEEEMQTLHITLTNTGKLCTKESMVRPSYIYKWEVPPSQCCNRVMNDPNIP